MDGRENVEKKNLEKKIYEKKLKKLKITNRNNEEINKRTKKVE